MAVAIKNSPAIATRSKMSQLGVASWIGTVFIVVSIAIIFYLIPELWGWLKPDSGTAVDVALKILTMLAVAAGLMFFGSRLTRSGTVHGLRAGICIGLIEVLVILLITCAVGNFFGNWFVESSRSLGVALTLATAVILLGLAIFYFTRPAFEQRLIQFEDQGWFSAGAYKRSQGQRVRRGTILGILIIAGCGIYTMLNRNVLVSGSPHWQVQLPFTNGQHLVLLPDLRFTLPLLLAVSSLWLAYRLVNFPAFADFLIATEAELNKVSWTTRRRLIQDTIVVLVTVVLFTLFLFFVDQLWAFILTKVGVIQIEPNVQQQIGPKEQPW